MAASELSKVTHFWATGSQPAEVNISNETTHT